MAKSNGEANKNKGFSKVKGAIGVKLGAYEHVMLEQAVRHVQSLVKNAGGKLTSIVWLPKARKLITVNKGPHVHKKAREQFQLESYKVALGILPNEQTKEALGRMRLPDGVSVLSVS